MRAVKHGDVSFEPRMHATTECANVASVVLKGVRASHFKVAMGACARAGLKSVRSVQHVDVSLTQTSKKMIACRCVIRTHTSHTIDDSMIMCLLNSQDDDSMTMFHEFAVLKGHACEPC